MKRILILCIISTFAFSLFSCGIIFKRTQDISGTWKGTVIVASFPQEDKTTVVFKRDNSGYSGHITESFGYLNQTPLKDIKVKDNTVTFSFVIESRGVKINSILNIEGDRMTGTFETEDGTDSGTYDLKKVEK